MDKVKLFTLLVASALASSAQAQHSNPVGADDKSLEYTVTVSDAAATTLAMNASKTIDELPTMGVEYVTFYLTFVHNSATAVTMSCESSQDATTWYQIHQLDPPSSGTVASQVRTWSNAVVGNENWSWSVTVNTFRYLRCTFLATSGAAADKLSIAAYASTEW